MSFKDQPYYQRFESLINDLGDELVKLTQEKKLLLQENQDLKAQLEQRNNANGGLFSHLSESEKKALRYEVTDLIRLIDKHISNQQ